MTQYIGLEGGFAMTKKMITAAAVAVLASAGFVSAQYQVDRSGATDANNRIGSGGRNIRSEQPKPWQLSNDIVYGNVTGGKAFRGNLSSTDPRAFRGSTATGVSDSFISQSSSVSTGGTASYNARQTQQFYGDSRGVAPPENFMQIPGSGSYIPPKPTEWRTTDPRISTLSSPVEVSFRPELFSMPGPIDAAFAPDAIVVPSIVQAQSLNPEQLSDYTRLNSTNANQLAPEQLNQLRQELGNTAGAAGERSEQGDSTDAAGLTGGALNDQVKPVQSSDAMKSSAIESSTTSDLGVQHRLVGAEQQSGVYAQLAQSAANRPQRPGDANAQAARDFNDALRARNEAADKTGETDQPTPKPGADQTPPGTGDKPAVDENVPNVGAGGKPPKFESLADKNKTGLNEILERAEKQMREGRFNSALDTYDQAEQVAPNNPLIRLGRAHAELGGGYYRRAELSLRQTLSADKTLLAGQYDLRSFIGADRLKVVEQDLRDLVQKNTNDTGAAVLLSYVYYNTANERRAAALLDLAEKRSEGKDPFVKMLKSNWTLPAAEPLDLNK
jgi:tetratricopeptide (TPR) repeat protein